MAPKSTISDVSPALLSTVIIPSKPSARIASDNSAPVLPPYRSLSLRFHSRVSICSITSGLLKDALPSSHPVGTKPASFLDINRPAGSMSCPKVLPISGAFSGLRIKSNSTGLPVLNFLPAMLTSARTSGSALLTFLPIFATLPRSANSGNAPANIPAGTKSVALATPPMPRSSTPCCMALRAALPSAPAEDSISLGGWLTKLLTP